MEKSLAVLVISLFAFGMGAFVLHDYFETRVFTAETCIHRETVTAVLYSKTPVGQCCWHVDGSDRCSESWFNCPMPIGTTIPWERDNYSCEHLEKQFEKPTIIEWVLG